MTTWLVGTLLLALASDGAASWRPPSNPDPMLILNEAQDDARAGRHAQALAKHEWIQREALKAQPAFYGVRLSFALSSWTELGRSYPPALTSLRRFRDEALEQVLSGKGGFAEFHDFESINDHLGDANRTLEAFLRIHKEKPDLAKQLYDLAEPELVEAKEYAVCGRYLEGEARWAQIALSHAMAKKMLDQLPPDHLGYMEKRFTHDTAMLIALLVLNERTSEAELVARKARAEWEDASFQAAIDAALNGTVPAPLP